MEDGEAELSDHGLVPNPDSSSDFQTSASMDSFLDEFLKNRRTCTHTHTCNPPGPDSAHTHTCHHTHTQVFPPGEDDALHGEELLVAKPRRAVGNREAVRKYREKKKAHTAYLEVEVKKLRLMNQQLTRKLQGQGILEAEILWLRGLLVDLRRKIDSELCVSPFQNKCNPTATSLKEGDCGMQSNGSAIGIQCQNEMPCFHLHLGSSLQDTDVVVGGGVSEEMLVRREGKYCQPAVIDCQANTRDVVNANGFPLDPVENLISSASRIE